MKILPLTVTHSYNAHIHVIIMVVRHPYPHPTGVGSWSHSFCRHFVFIVKQIVALTGSFFNLSIYKYWFSFSLAWVLDFDLRVMNIWFLVQEVRGLPTIAKKPQPDYFLWSLFLPPLLWHQTSYIIPPTWDVTVLGWKLTMWQFIVPSNHTAEHGLRIDSFFSTLEWVVMRCCRSPLYSVNKIL